MGKDGALFSKDHCPVVTFRVTQNDKGLNK